MNASITSGQFIPDLSAQAYFMPVLSVERFSELISIEEGVVRGWMAKGYLPTYRIGKYTLINIALLNHMAMQKAPSL